jgi:hypothetical protein
MTIPASGQLSFRDINVETSTTATWQLSVDDERFRSLAGGSTGAVSLSGNYGSSFNGFYFYPRQTSTAGWNIVQQLASRSNSQLRNYIGTDGSISTDPFGTTISSTSAPVRFYTPITTGIAGSATLQIRIQQTSWTGTTGVGSWNWNIGFSGSTWGATTTMDTGWVNYDSPILFSQSLVSPGAAFDVTAGGTISMRQTAAPGTVISVPFTFRVFAL